MKITVFGLGYVGMVNIACLSKLGNTVIGVDVKPHKVDLVKSGKSTVFEPMLDELMTKGKEQGLIDATSDVAHTIANTDVALVCVGTPSSSDGEVNTSYILNTTRDIAMEIKKHPKKYTIIYRSTIPPGTIETIVIPELKSLLQNSFDLVNVVFLPEFLREGSAVKDFYEGDRVVAGLNEDEKGKEVITEMFGFNPSTPIEFTDFKTAEFVKYVDNAYHATKVAFANEIYSIGSNLGVDVKRANDIFLMDKKLNISARYLKPGAPFGGSCLPKDTRAIVKLARMANVEIPFFNGLIQSNKEQQKRLLEKVQGFQKKKVLLYGLTFKQNTDDIRESPFLFLLNDMIAQGMEVQVYDPALNLMNLRLDFPHVSRYIRTDLTESLDWADLVVINKAGFIETLKDFRDKKIFINCMDNNSYSSQFKEIHNLY